MTVKQLAKVTGRSEQGIRSYLKRTKVPQINGRYVLTPDIEREVIRHFGTPGEAAGEEAAAGAAITIESETEKEAREAALQAKDDLIESLKSQVERQNMEIDQLNARLSQLQTALDQQQRLSLMDKQQLAELQNAALPWFRRKKAQKLIDSTP